MKLVNLLVSAVALFSAVSAAPTSYSKSQCGKNYGSCDKGYCCSKYGWCGKTEDYCGKGCQSEFGICNTTTTKKSNPTTTSTSTSTYGAGNIEWAGFRFSQGGIKESFGYVPDGDEWVKLMNKWKSHFNSDAKPAVVVIVSQNSEDTINRFDFPKPKGVSSHSYIKYADKDKYENVLTKFDKMGYNVWLQVEPGNNDLVTLAEIVFKQYGHHSCIKGFGIDLEWWYRRDHPDVGKKLSDSNAKKIVNYVRSINPEYTVFAKHWDDEFMPPTYRDGMIFINDSQDTSLDRFKKEFKAWAKKFSGNPVMFQIGYNEDRSLWKNDPIDYAKTLIKEITPYNKHVGMFWVDFSLKEASKKM